MTHSELQSANIDDVEVIPFDHAMVHAKLVRHITEMNSIIRKDRQIYFDEVVVDLLEKEVEEAIAFIKLVEKHMINPMQIISKEQPKSGDSNDIYA